MQDEQSSYRPAIVRGTQIISFATIAGPSFFLGATLLMAGDKQPRDFTMAYIAAVVTAIDIPMRILVPRMIANHQVRHIVTGEFAGVAQKQLSRSPMMQLSDNITDADYLALVYRTKTIVGNALVVGVVFLWLVAYVVTDLWWCQAAAGLLLAVLVVTFPTTGRVDNWITEQLRVIELERSQQAVD